MNSRPLYFCTLFDSHYFYKGLSLYRSLVEHCADFKLYILCMDRTTHDLLSRLNLSRCTLIELEDFEDDDLRAVKPTRSRAEYCWTCTPSLILYVLKQNPEIDLVSYLDADLLFFGDPLVILDEFGDNSIMIIEHRFPAHLKYLEVNGIYNVQMMAFRRDANGLDCLDWWRARCLEWCYNRLEDGKLGDQKYLDDWTERFAGVHVLQHLGAGVAPWNACNYEITMKHGKIYIDDVPLIFYHFHQFKILRKRKYFYAADIYEQKKKLPAVIYKQYIAQIEESMLQVKKIAPSFQVGVENDRDLLLLNLARKYLSPSVKNLIKKTINKVSGK